ncbi:protein of unknown function [Magnetospirillum gryphiswaldense MSR-1 v2]|uniref:Uncharacterized protein n=2 Tax=Magnetospirillum gryphiswaldense TaxID=55518 RepID=V6F088_MAGGM|nr:hypothetical protein MGR_3498 [Magnetospirillum gryphiswaldense MSR-1]CDK98915.1 protein of unknown function [Magnetospirillum gryphiswaldense MSR-1 v2]
MFALGDSATLTLRYFTAPSGSALLFSGPLSGRLFVTLRVAKGTHAITECPRPLQGGSDVINIRLHCRQPCLRVRVELFAWRRPAPKAALV